MTEPWRDRSRYETGRIVKCLECQKDCHLTNWGAWCYDCNVARITSINAAFEPFRKAIEESNDGSD